MDRNPLAPQASAIFDARLENLVGTLKRDVTRIKQDFNSRNVLISTGTLVAIFECMNAAIIDMASTATESAILAHKAGSYRFTVELEGQLLDAFEANFSRGYARLSSLRASSTQEIRDGLSNKKMHEDDNGFGEGAHAKIEGQLALRQYFQEVKRSQKSLYSYVYDIARVLLPFLFRGH